MRQKGGGDDEAHRGASLTLHEALPLSEGKTVKHGKMARD